MKKFLFMFLVTFLFSNEFAKNVLPKKIYIKYKGLINSLIKKDTPLKETLVILKENGLLDIFLKRPQIINTTFVFKNNNPILETKILYDTLYDLGYYYFYPIYIKKESNSYIITIQMKSNHYIDPLNFIQKTLCKVTNIKKQKNFTYYLDCKNVILKVKSITDTLSNYTSLKEDYIFKLEDFKKVFISTSKYDKFHPFIVFYDKNLNELEIISNNNVKRKLILKIPPNAFYIKIRDNFTKENIKRGIFIKGIK